MAFDGTFQTQAHLVIEVEDINDNRPEFSGPYFYQVNPRATIGTKFGQVVAKDKDATSRNNRILYVLSQGSGGKFGVDFNSGMWKNLQVFYPNSLSLICLFFITISNLKN